MYFKEDDKNFSDYIDCYWESDDLSEKKTYPSLPEPFINIFFPINSSDPILIKGISVRPDYLEINSQLFGVRLYLKGFLQLKLGPSSEFTNQIVDLRTISSTPEVQLERWFRNSGSFEERVEIFQNYFKEKLHSPLSRKKIEISAAFDAMISGYEDPNFICNYSKKCGKSERTILRWFTSEIGINTKLLVRVLRFHNSLSSLHSYEEKGFYFKHGYFDQAHFIREFKYFSGFSPEKYRKMIERFYA